MEALSRSLITHCLLVLYLHMVSSAPTVVSTSTTECRPRSADIVFMVDGSSSIYGQHFTRTLQFVTNMTEEFGRAEASIRVGVVIIGEKPKLALALTQLQDVAEVNRQLEDIKQPMGGTNTAAALHYLRERLFHRKRSARHHVVKIGIVITDGRSDIPESTWKEAELSRKAGIHLFSVGVGGKVDRKELQRIASSPKQNYTFYVETFTGLSSIQGLLAEQACTATQKDIITIITNEDRMPTDNTHAAEIDPKERCSIYNPADIVFILPPSATPEETNRAIDLVVKVSERMDIGEKEVHIGLVPRQDYTVPELRLDDFDEKMELTSRLKARRFTKAKMADEFRYLRTQSFSKCHGSRTSVQKMAVVILGKDTTNVKSLIREATKVKLYGIELFVVTVGLSPEIVEQAQSLASSREHVFPVSDYRSMHHKAHSIIRHLNKSCAHVKK